MKRLLLILFFLTYAFASQAQVIEWVKKQENYIEQSTTVIAASDSTVLSAGARDGAVNGFILLQNRDKNGNIRWIKKFRSPDVLTYPYSNFANFIGLDSLENIYVAGTFQDALLMDQDTLLTRSGAHHFLLKLSKAGSVLWARVLPELKGADVDAFGNTYITGSFKGTINIANQTLTTTSAQVPEMYTAKINPNG
ncbi:MAG: hypothetical protein LPK19_02440 [Hymenobacteraceae bacterium]|nr:hypothetical protein [Hymenobacteraceae bacterium]MDX5395039.1 hypothetical protein [Hymenobacteraceae bacterium]MDX5511073.1 hypothetical protein [Hymenobacteraceae bacterium]